MKTLRKIIKDSRLWQFFDKEVVAGPKARKKVVNELVSAIKSFIEKNERGINGKDKSSTNRSR